jgi:hypothetical protein
MLTGGSTTSPNLCILQAGAGASGGKQQQQRNSFPGQQRLQDANAIFQGMDANANSPQSSSSDAERFNESPTTITVDQKSICLLY